MRSLRSIGQEKLSEVTIPFVPPKIALSHLYIENKDLPPILLTSQQVIKVKQCLSKLKDGRFDKTWLAKHGVHSSYANIKQGDQYFAMYHGADKNRHCGKGIFGTVKYIQNIETGDWALLKIQSTNNAPPLGKDIQALVADRGKHEADILNRLDLFLGAFERVSHNKGYQHAILMKLIKGFMLERFRRGLFEKNTSSDFLWLSIARSCCQAVSDLHQKQMIVHYDIHSENIIYQPASRTASLIDFGMAEACAHTNKMADAYYDDYRLGETLAELLGMVDARGVFFSKKVMGIFNLSKFQDENLCLKVRHFIRHRLIGDTVNRVTAQDASLFFDELLAAYSDRQKRVKFVEVNELLTAGLPDLSALKQYDSIVLVDRLGRYTMKDYIYLKRRLESADLVVASKVLVIKPISSRSVDLETADGKVSATLRR